MTTTDNRSLYDDSFYDANERGSYAAARIVLGMVLPMLEPSSVLDVGCGVGTWLRAALDFGASRIFGVDGEHVDLGRLRIDTSCFAPVDLATQGALAVLLAGRRFDLTMCLETAEHLPADAARDLVAALSRTADVVLFSAALPGQGGTHHVNERPLTYWAALWHDVGFVPLDVVRPGLQNASLDVWYGQNVILFVRPEQADRIRASFQAYYNTTIGFMPPLAFVHPTAASRWLGLPHDQALDHLRAFAEGFGSRLTATLDRPDDAVERVDMESEGRLTMVGWRPAAAQTVEPYLLLRLHHDMLILAGLYFPTWFATEAQTASARARAKTNGLVWASPTGQSIDGWAELADPALVFKLSVSMLDGTPGDGSVIETARDAALLWRRYYSGIPSAS